MTIEPRNQTDSADCVRYQAVMADIARAARDCGRESADVQLVCVTKTVEQARLRPILAAGHRVFGENRVQEAQGKWPTLKADYPDLALHLIGPLQSNKARDAVLLFDVIETIDRPRIAAAIAQAMRETGKSPKLYVQINIGAEPQKAGVAVEDADAFLAACLHDHGLQIAGLMCIPPADQQASPYFALLGVIAKRNDISILSMGMSADYDLAIQLGATHVRVGSAIFGHR